MILYVGGKKRIMRGHVMVQREIPARVYVTNDRCWCDDCNLPMGLIKSTEKKSKPTIRCCGCGKEERLSRRLRRIHVRRLNP